MARIIFKDIEPRIPAIMPVQGRVGAMTIAVLLNDCVEAVRK